MNRLIIIGNGFDLAHGLPTSYKDFIDDFWKNFKEKHKTKEYQDLIFVNELYDKFYSNYGLIDGFSAFKSSIYMNIEDYPELYFDEINLIYYTSKYNGQKVIFEFRNDFFKLICKETTISNWVDVENLYYRELKRIVKDKGNDYSKPEGFWVKEKNKNVKNLNIEFDQLKKLLENYLFNKVIKEYNFSEYRDVQGFSLKFPHLFKPVAFKDNSEDFLKEFPKPLQNEIQNQFVYRGDDIIYDCELTFLSFNYTPTLINYINILKHWSIKTDEIYIHGEINNKNNSINFGFGDEMDEDYKMIENIDDNEYLKNFKSFQYLHTPNYKRLLDLIDSEIFQVYIVGHSCGLSDRTLLNTIFEHKNCASIKPFYYEIEDQKGQVIGDNYTEITQNISRHFNDKKLMREKIVNKTLCQPLPQIQLPKK